jgi:hypothetical protein
VPFSTNAQIKPIINTIQPIIIIIGNILAERGFDGRPELRLVGHFAITRPPNSRSAVAIEPSAIVIAPSNKPKPTNFRAGTHVGMLCRTTLAATSAEPAPAASRVALSTEKNVSCAFAPESEKRKATMTMIKPSQANI